MVRYDAREAAFYRRKLIERAQADVRECYQCGNCTAGCPAAFTFDYTPNQLMRMLQVGLVDRVLDSKAVQLCVQCLTCTARCPRDIDIAGIFEDLKTIATAQERRVPEHAKTFNRAFMRTVAWTGRLPELYMMAMFYVGTKNPMRAVADLGLVVPLVRKGKMQFVPSRAKGTAEVARIYKKTLAIAKKRAKAEAKARAKMAAEEARAVQAAREACSVCGGVAGDGHTHGAESGSGAAAGAVSGNGSGAGDGEAAA